MSAEDNNAIPSTNQRRRSSFIDIFANRPTNDPSNVGSATSKPAGSAMAAAMAQQSRTRRLSITSLGLSGSPTHGQPTSPFGTLRERGQSLADSNKSTDETGESAIDEDTDPATSSKGSRSTSPSVPRRMSFGAKAHRDQRASSGASSIGATTSGNSSTNNNTGKVPSSPNARKDVFNWSDNLRNRAERSSISTAAGSSGGGFLPLTSGHNRTKSVATSENPPPTVSQPTQAPKPAPKPAPDHFQERILKGDFYMD